MIKMASIHLSYMMNKRTLLFIALSNVGFIGMTLYQIHFDGSRYEFLLFAQDHMQMYAHEMILFMRIMMLFFILFLTMLTSSRHYEWFYLAFINRFTMVSTKLLSWMIMFSIQLLFFICCYVYAPLLMHEIHINDRQIVVLSVSLWLELGIVLIMLLLIKERFENPFGGYLVIVIYWISLILVPTGDPTIPISIFHFVMPIAMFNAYMDASFLFGSRHVLLWLITLLGLIIVIYVYKDL